MGAGDGQKNQNPKNPPKPFYSPEKMLSSTLQVPLLANISDLVLADLMKLGAQWD